MLRKLEGAFMKVKMVIRHPHEGKGVIITQCMVLGVIWYFPWNFLKVILEHGFHCPMVFSRGIGDLSYIKGGKGKWKNHVCLWISLLCEESFSFLSLGLCSP